MCPTIMNLPHTSAPWLTLLEILKQTQLHRAPRDFNLSLPDDDDDFHLRSGPQLGRLPKTEHNSPANFPHLKPTRKKNDENPNQSTLLLFIYLFPLTKILRDVQNELCFLSLSRATIKARLVRVRQQVRQKSITHADHGVNEIVWWHSFLPMGFVNG